MPALLMKFEGLVSDEYREDVLSLIEDPVVLAMFAELPGEYRANLVSGKFMSGFSEGARREYRSRGGEGGKSLGAIGWALTELSLRAAARR